MNKTQAMKQLKALGSEQTRKTYLRHGASEPVFGVRYADLYKLVKSIGTDHGLAMKLWETGNHDACVLATMIADPEAMKHSELDAWAKTATSQLSLDAIASLACKTPHARKCFDTWTKSKKEWVAAAGWHVFSGGCCGRPGAAPGGIADESNAFFEEQLARIEETIHASPNRVRHSMNSALIAIGGRGGAMEKKALAAAKRIGAVEVDHGDTSCKTPDAATYIRKMTARRKPATKKKTAKKKTAKKKTARR